MASERKLSEWETIGTLSIAGRLSVSDSSYFYDEPILLSVPPGEYSVMIRYGTSEGVKYVRGLRVARGKDVVRGSQLDVVVVDFGQIGVGDRDTLEKVFDALGDAGMQSYYGQLQTTDLVKRVSLPNKVEMFIARSGFGDGVYPIYVLGSSGQMPAGIEIDFEHSLRQ